jgi:multiple sugar transport system permease protein/sn-glycerol 3-phosphate transport system permease protein
VTNATTRQVPLRWLNYLLMIVVGAIVVVPLFWLVTSALKPSAEIYRWPLTWIPSRPEWSNFIDAWNAAPFAKFFLNSTIVTVIGAAIKLVLALTTAYAFVFLRFPAKNILFLVMLGALMVPGHVTLLVNYLTVSDLGWINTYAGLIVPGVASVLGTFLLRQYMMTIPKELVEAATMDGAGHLRILLTLIVPLARPTIITVAMIAIIDDWNSFIWPLIVTNTVDMRTLPVGLLYLKDNEGFNNWGAIMAGTTMVAVPILILFFIAQRYVVAGLTQGAVKG